MPRAHVSMWGSSGEWVPPAGGGTLRSDNFNRANEDPLNVPSDGGSAWVELLGTDWNVNGNVARIGGVVWTPAVTYLEASNSNVIVKAKMTAAPSSPNSNWGLTARIVDADNHWRVVYRINVPDLALQKRVAGSFTTVGTPAAGSLSVNDEVSLEVNSSHQWTVKVNGSPVITGVTDSDNSSGTKHGLVAHFNSGPDTMSWDDFSVTAN